MSNDFSQPTEIDAVTAAFPGSVRHLMPDYRELDEKYRRHYGTWANKLFSDWFFCGITSLDGLVPKEGIDKAKALRHIRAVMGSFEPKHEHKEAACAFLFDKWFESTSKWERADGSKAG
jgi:hypothetical protein